MERDVEKRKEIAQYSFTIERGRGGAEGWEGRERESAMR